jgi:hypothetical protein
MISLVMNYNTNNKSIYGLTQVFLIFYKNRYLRETNFTVSELFPYGFNNTPFSLLFPILTIKVISLQELSVIPVIGNCFIF